MAQLTKAQVHDKERKKETYYSIVRCGNRSTFYYFSDFDSAIAKYDAICKGNRQNLLVVLMVRENPPGSKYASEFVYTTNPNTKSVGCTYRDVGAKSNFKS